MLDQILHFGWEMIVTAGMLLGVVILAGPLGYFLFYSLAKANILFTIVEQGWCRIILEWGEYYKTIGPGLHLIGIPGMRSLYKRKMAFLKGAVKDDGSIIVEAHKDKNITSFKTTKYPYAIPFKDEEDCHGLPLSGVVVVNGRMVDGFKMFFVASDWYATIVFLVLVELREIITMISYEEMTGQCLNPKAAANTVRKTVAQLLWKKMTDPREGGSKLSVIAELLQTYGFEVDSVELASIDPPADWRAITLAPYKAEKEKEAAIHQAETSAVLFDDTNQALEVWKKTHPGASSEQILEKQQELSRRAYLKAGGQYQEIHGLENANVVGFGGGGIGAFVGAGGGKGNRGKGGVKAPEDMTSEELEEWAKNYKKKKKGE